MRNSPENIEVRRNKIKLLLSLGFPQSEIARQVKVSLRTIVYDIKEIRKEWTEQIRKIDFDQIVNELRFELDNRRRELYTIAQREGAEDRDKISAFRAVGEETDRFVRLLQNFGKIEKVPEKLDADVTYKIITAIPRTDNHVQDAPEEAPRGDNRRTKRKSNLSRNRAKKR